MRLPLDGDNENIPAAHIHEGDKTYFLIWDSRVDRATNVCKHHFFTHHSPTSFDRFMRLWVSRANFLCMNFMHVIGFILSLFVPACWCNFKADFMARCVELFSIKFHWCWVASASVGGAWSGSGGPLVGILALVFNYHPICCLLPSSWECGVWFCLFYCCWQLSYFFLPYLMPVRSVFQCHSWHLAVVMRFAVVGWWVLNISH